MIAQRGPHNRGKCPFYVTPQNPLSAGSSIDHCADCVIGNKAQLLSFKEDLRQLAFLTILEETPKYDPDHPSGASYITFTQARTIENVADTVIQQIEIETLRKHLPKLLETLNQKEKNVIQMKFFQEFSGREIAQILEVSEGRVSQITKSALEKLGKAYLTVLEKVKGNPYRDSE